MKVTIALLLLACTAVYAEGTFGFKEEEDVLVLTDTTLPEAIAKFDFLLVEFYAPWCGHCKKLAPEYAKAAAALKKLETPMPIAKVDATENSEAAKTYGVQGYPTLKFFINGSPIDFNGGRTADEIVNWIKKKTGPASTLIANAGDMQKAETDNKIFAVYFTHGQPDETGFDAFKKVALKYDGIPFFHVDSEAVFSRFQFNSMRMALFTDFEKFTFLGTDKQINEADISAHIEANRYPLVMEFEGDDAINRIFQGEKETAFFFSDNESHEFHATFEALAKADASESGKPLIFSKSKMTSGLGQRLADFVGAKASDGEAIWIVKPGQNLEKYRHTGELSEEAVREFIASWRSGSVEKHLKSAEVPAHNDEPVKVVVGKNFQELVVDNDNWVLLEFYAPWCGHCKSLAPIYDELAKDLAHIENLTIAKIDATENEVPSVSVQGFPTLKLFAPGKKTSAIAFDAERTLEGLKKTLKEHMKGDYVEKEETGTDL